MKLLKLQFFWLFSHGSNGSVKCGLCSLSFLKERPSNGWVNLGQVSEHLLWNWIILEEFESLSLTSFQSQTLDVVVNQTGQVWVWTIEFSLTFFRFEILLLNSILKDLDSSVDVVLQEQSACKKVVGLHSVASDSFWELVELVNHLI